MNDRPGKSGEHHHGIGAYWPVFVPVIPVLFAVGLMEFLGIPEKLTAVAFGDLAQSGIVALRHAADRINYGSAVAIHTGVCLSAITYFAVVLHRVVTDNRAALFGTIALTVVAVLAMMVLLAQVDPKLAIYRISYFYIETMLNRSGAAPDLTDATLWGVPRLAFAALYPSAIGIVSVVMGAGVACSVLRRIGPPAADGWAGSFRANIKILFHSFYVLSAVLVTSTASALLFYRMPAGLVPAKGPTADLAASLAIYAGSAGTFWGAIYTLTLLSVFVGPFAVLFVRARRHVHTLEKSQDLSDWMRDHGFDTSLSQTLKNALIVLAPLLVGPLGEITKTLG